MPRFRWGRPSGSVAKISELTDLLDAPECDAGRVRIEIWVDGVDPPAGHVADGGVGVPFCGWIDLLAVLPRDLSASTRNRSAQPPLTPLAAA